MKKPALSLFVLALLLASAAPESDMAASNGTEDAAGDPRELEAEDDVEGDSAPFTIVVAHGDGRRCGGSLVSLRTALTSAGCARGRGARPPRELWALAPPGPADARRVARLALPADWAPASGDSWAGAALDVAVLELEAPFGGVARARPILMATRAEECAARALCHVVRARGRAPRLSIVDASLVPGEACALRARGWPAVRDSALCLVGPELCASDRGAGVVCGGKLCGVLSRSAGAAVEAGAEAPAGCGDTHVAQSVARWRRFLHCAHTLRACGRGGECAQLCTELRLLGPSAEGEPPSAAPPASPPAPPAPTALFAPHTAAPHRTLEYIASSVPSANKWSSVADLHSPTRTSPASTERTTAAPATAAPAALAPSMMERPARPALEFEPNRPDFKVGPARTSRMKLKAGEYGDNAAEYVGEDGLCGASSAAATRPPPMLVATEAAPDSPSAAAAAAANYSEPEARRQSGVDPARGSCASPPRGLMTMLLAVFAYCQHGTNII